MSIPEFLQLGRRQLTLEEIMSNKSTRNFIVVLLASVMYASNAFAAGKGVDSLGNTLLTLIRQWAYWVILIMCIVEVIRAGVSGDSKKILSIVSKYVIVFASMYLVPSLFDAIRSSF